MATTRQKRKASVLSPVARRVLLDFTELLLYGHHVFEHLHAIGLILFDGAAYIERAILPANWVFLVESTEAVELIHQVHLFIQQVHSHVASFAMCNSATISA